MADGLNVLALESAAFADATQATAVIELPEPEVLPGYLTFHRDLLFHQDPQDLFGPFFLGRVCEAILQEGAPWDETAQDSGRRDPASE